MLGPKKEAQAALFYEFWLEDHVLQDHLLWLIDRFVDLGNIRAHLADFYSHTGRPSVDPELLIYYPAVHVYMHERAHAAGRVLLRHPVRAAALRRGAPEPGIQVVLSPRPERQRPGSLHILEEPACIARQAIA